eukprot:TRINITY_DN6295_c0_g1_i2.p1 TRINITY_DN6295_c0_g1~~TRINITY_DN6295_c0_g1_i2.p1  ORF type:complete len:1036 (-),score=143.87 TRINITY_DN6295_c0_g1_i2:1162-4203(-)
MPTTKAVRDLLLCEPRLAMDVLYRQCEAPHSWLRSLLSVLLEQNTAVSLLKGLITEEVDASAHCRTLFRTNSLCTYALTHMAHVVGRPFMQDVIKTVVLHVLSFPLPVEVSLRRIVCLPTADVSEVARENTANLILLGESVFELISQHVHKIPRRLRILCQHLKAEVERKFAQDAVPSIAIGGYIFLRFICPVLVSPTKFGVYSGTVSPAEQRKLVLVSKMLQNLSNQVPFNECDMKNLNFAFVQPLTPKMNALQLSLVELAGIAQTPIAVKSTQLRRIRSFLLLHSQALHTAFAAHASDKGKDLLLSVLKDSPVTDDSRTSTSGHLRSVSAGHGQEFLSVYESHPQCNQLLWLFLNSKKVLITMLYKMVAPKMKDTVALFAFQLWGASEERLVGFLRHAVEIELDQNDRIGELFRLSSLSSNVCSIAMKNLAGHFASQVVELCEKLMRSQASLPSLCDFVQDIILFVEQRLQSLPAVVGKIANVLHDVCEERIPGSGMIAVSGLFFQRYICVLLVRAAADTKKGFSNEEEKMLISASRVLQKLATDVDFRDADDLYPMNSFIAAHRQDVHALLKKVLQVQSLRFSSDAKRGLMDYGLVRLSRDCVEAISHLVLENQLDILSQLAKLSAPYFPHMSDKASCPLSYKADVALENAITSLSKEESKISSWEVTIEINSLARFLARKHQYVYIIIRKDGRNCGISDIYDVTSTNGFSDKFVLETGMLGDPLMLEVYSSSDEFIGSGRVVLSNKTTPEQCISKVFCVSQEESRKIESGVMSIGVRTSRRVAGVIQVLHCSKPRSPHPLPLSEDDWRRLMASSSLLEHHEGDLALAKGQRNTSLYRVVSGSYRAELDGKVLGELSRGSVFGDLSFLGREESMCDVICSGEGSQVRVISASFLCLLLESEPTLFAQFYFHLARVLATRLAAPPKVAKLNRMESANIPQEVLAQLKSPDEASRLSSEASLAFIQHRRRSESAPRSFDIGDRVTPFQKPMEHEELHLVKRSYPTRDLYCFS